VRYRFINYLKNIYRRRRLRQHRWSNIAYYTYCTCTIRRIILLHTRFEEKHLSEIYIKCVALLTQPYYGDVYVKGKNIY